MLRSGRLCYDEQPDLLKDAMRVYKSCRASQFKAHLKFIEISHLVSTNLQKKGASNMSNTYTLDECPKVPVSTVRRDDGEWLRLGPAKMRILEDGSNTGAFSLSNSQVARFFLVPWTDYLQTIV